MGKFDELGDAVRRLLVDDVHKVWIDDMAPMPDLDPEAIYHVTHPKAAKAIIEQGMLIPNAGTPKWGMSGAQNSSGKVFLTNEQGVGRWVGMIGQQMPHMYDSPPEKLAVIQFRNPHMPVAEALRTRAYEVPFDDVGRPMPTQPWSPRLYQDIMGSKDADSNAFFIQGAVPISAPPRVKRIVSRYSVLAPLAAPLLSEGEN